MEVTPLCSYAKVNSAIYEYAITGKVPLGFLPELIRSRV